MSKPKQFKYKFAEPIHNLKFAEKVGDSFMNEEFNPNGWDILRAVPNNPLGEIKSTHGRLTMPGDSIARLVIKNENQKKDNQGDKKKQK
ncbi:MAG TPA: hypothetical protein DD473_03630 [Planctomycetaceae bacterium]|nr:hypothetical protein [Planctomycetaceae bacterium]